MSNIIPIDQVRVMATSVAKSGLYGVKNIEQAFTLMLIAQAENTSPIQAMQMYDVIQGRPALKSSEILSRFQRADGKIRWVETTNEKAIVELEHPSYNGKYLSEYTIKDAELAGLTSKQNWKQRPKEMLRSRAVSSGVRAVYPACLNNMYSSEEIQDIEPTEPEIIETVEDVEVVETKPNVDYNKKLLADKLRKANYNQAMMKAFFDLYITSDEILEQVVNDEKLFNELLDKYDS